MLEKIAWLLGLTSPDIQMEYAMPKPQKTSTYYFKTGMGITEIII